jgi:hypothetical protein
MGRRIVAKRGRVLLKIDGRERELMRSLLAELRELLSLDADDPRVRRLYPAAYAADPEKEDEYRRLTHEELRDGRLASLDAVEASLDAKELNPDQLTAWMQSVNALRLIIGTILDVSEDDVPFAFDPEDPDARNMALYGYLGVLLEEIVDVQLS